MMARANEQIERLESKLHDLEKLNIKLKEDVSRKDYHVAELEKCRDEQRNDFENFKYAADKRMEKYDKRMEEADKRMEEFERVQREMQNAGKVKVIRKPIVVINRFERDQDVNARVARQQKNKLR